MPLGFRSLRLQRLSTRRQVHQRLRLLFGGYYSNSRVLTFDHAGFWQRSLSSRHFGLRLRGWSELLGGRRDFFFRHRRRGFIPLPGQIRRLPVKYTSRLSVKQDYYIKVLLGKIQHLQA
jgi:hypothetical protein